MTLTSGLLIFIIFLIVPYVGISGCILFFMYKLLKKFNK